MERGVKLKHSIFKTVLFKEHAARLDAWEQVDELKQDLDKNPFAGARIPGGNGIRKIRIGLPGRGKRGGARVIYYVVTDEETIALLNMYAKNEKENLDSDELDRMVKLKDKTIQQIKE